MVELENLCEVLSYGAPKPKELAEKAIKILQEIENRLGEEK